MPARGLQDLTPTEFENLIFDIMIARGMANVTWRTPGADGGRDIEGNVVESDFSLSQSMKKWYVECKRYTTSSVDWPTIYPKVAYAHSNNADILLVCASGTISPQAVNEVTKWNADKKGPSIRLWTGHQIEAILSQHQDISWKYGLKDAPTPIAGSTLAIMLALSKSVGSFYSSEVMNDKPIAPMLKAAQSLAQLLQGQMENTQHFGQFKFRKFAAAEYDVPGCTIDPLACDIDGTSFMAFLNYLQALQVKPLTVSKAASFTAMVICDVEVAGILNRYNKTFESIALWGDFEYSVDPNDAKSINFKQR